MINIKDLNERVSGYLVISGLSMKEGGTAKETFLLCITGEFRGLDKEMDSVSSWIPRLGRG